MRKQSENSLQASKQKEQSRELDRSDSKSVQTDNEELETESLDEALGHWTSQLPPFIDYAIPTSMEPGESMQVWKASENAAPVKKNSPKTLVTCRAWKDTGFKYWTCDIHEWRHIVGGIGVPNSRGFYAWFIWHGLEHNGFTKKRVLWTTSEKGHTTTFTPKVKPLEDGTFLGQTDSNHFMREQDKILRNLKMGTSNAQLSNDSPAASHAQRPSRRQRETSPSSQLQSPTSPSDDGESMPQLSQRPKRHRPNTGFYAQQLILNELNPTIQQNREELDKASLLADQSERTLSTNINPEAENVTEIQRFVAPTATMTPRIASTAATEVDLDAIEALDVFSSPTLRPAKRNVNSKASASVTIATSAGQSPSQGQRHPEPVKPRASGPTEPPSSTPNNTASPQPPPPRENDEPSTAPGNIDTPESPLSEEDQLKREIYDLKQAQLRLKLEVSTLKLEQTTLALEQKLEQLAKTQRAKAN